MNVNINANLFPAGSLNTKHRIDASMNITSGVLCRKRDARMEEKSN